MNHYLNPTMSIQKCLNICNFGDIIYLSNGVYKEKIKITKKNIKFIGESKENTIIEYDDYYLKIYKDNNETNTFRTYTVMVNADNIKFSNLTIKNSCFNSKKYGQSVALHVLGDNFFMENCILSSGQDTLFTGPLPNDLQKRYANFLEKDELENNPSKQYYYKTTIVGDFDFIFGCGDVLFEECNIISIGPGYVAAPSHELSQTYGFIFLNCWFKSQNAPNNSVYLARPWRDYGSAHFINPILESHINSQVFNKWDNTNRDKTCRFYLYNSNKDCTNIASFAHVNNDYIYIRDFVDLLRKLYDIKTFQ